MIRLIIPVHLRRLANIEKEVSLPVNQDATFASVLDALEEQYPMLKGTIRDQISKERRAYIRYFACGEDYSHQPPETRLPEAILNGEEALRIIGAMSGG
jgi:hypothetical protein